MEKIILLSILLFCIHTKPFYAHDTKSQIEIKESVQHKVQRTFNALIIDTETKNEFIPSQTKILSVQWDGSILILDVSKDINSYGGGTAIEFEIMCQLLNTAFSIPEVEFFTLLIEGKEEYLPEGTQILNYSRQRYMINVTRY